MMNAMPSTAAAAVPPQQQEQSGDSSSTTTSSSNQINSFAIQVQGRKLLVPQTDFSRAVMGNETSCSSTSSAQQQEHNNKDTRPLSNLSLLLQQQTPSNVVVDAATSNNNHNPPMDEADSACRPRRRQQHPLGSSAPMMHRSDAQHYYQPQPPSLLAPETLLQRHASTGTFRSARRCLSSKELVTLAPPSGSPYAAMLHQKEEIEFQTRQRLTELLAARGPDKDLTDESTTSSSANQSGSLLQRVGKREGANQSRNRRRSEHYHAVVNDLCEIVADLFLAESKLIKPVQYGVQAQDVSRRTEIVQAIQEFVAALPTRYALGADTPSEVLLHMRLMAAARAEKTKAVIHIHSLQEGEDLHRHHHRRQQQQQATSAGGQRMLRLVTICCSDADGLLELITKNLSSGGSRVMDADVMLSSDGIALDRFVVEMTGRLRLDKLAQRIESFLKHHAQIEKERSTSSSSSLSSSLELGGSIYFNEAKSPNLDSNIQEDLRSAVPLLDVLDSSRHRQQSHVNLPPELPNLRKTHSMPVQLETRKVPLDPNELVAVPPPPPVMSLPMRRELSAGVSIPTSPELERPHEAALPDYDPTPRTKNSNEMEAAATAAGSNRQRRPLVNRKATYDLDGAGYTPRPNPLESSDVDYLTVPAAHGTLAEDHRVPLIPFEELMLIETIGTGRVSTIYRAVWQRPAINPGELSSVRMVALKVAMVNGVTGDTAHVDELRREADIAARLSHPNICALTGVAADSECFCLAYDFAEGGSLHSLLSDSSRYYEYLPIALDVANGMAYLHSRNIIHRDLKPSNILLTRDHRAKICDFGMSIMNAGQELTAETGTYRYMAPEVIRHENYSSNADVYSFGICLWQLITREVPFANMTPIQAAYAVAEGRRPTIPRSTPRRLQEIIMACWDQDSYRRPSFTYVAMALADYAKMAFSPANVGALTLQIANEMLATVKGNSTVNVDFSTPVSSTPPRTSYLTDFNRSESINSDVGLQI